MSLLLETNVLCQINDLLLRTPPKFYFWEIARKFFHFPFMAAERNRVLRREEGFFFSVDKKVSSLSLCSARLHYYFVAAMEIVSEQGAIVTTEEKNFPLLSLSHF